MLQSLPRSLDGLPQVCTEAGHAAVALAAVMPRNVANAHVVADIHSAAPFAPRVAGADWFGLDVISDMLRDFCLSDMWDDDQHGFPDAASSLKVQSTAFACFALELTRHFRLR
jgi:hypothetical protein